MGVKSPPRSSSFQREKPLPELNWLTIQEARNLLTKREVSSVELTRACLERTEAVEGKVRSFITLTPDIAPAAGGSRRPDAGRGRVFAAHRHSGAD